MLDDTFAPTLLLQQQPARLVNNVQISVVSQEFDWNQPEQNYSVYYQYKEKKLYSTQLIVNLGRLWLSR